jgi:phospholipid/cholesterol/gamma-HCH transport system substrate-binding protein
MRRSWAPVVVGIFVVAVVALSYFLIRATSERRSGATGYAVWGLFRDAAGLFEKSRVQTAGISVGQIDKRELDAKTKRARITIRILPHIKLYENAVVMKKSASLLGEFYLEVDPGSPEAEIRGEIKQMRELKDGDQILNVIEPTTTA